LQLTQKEYEEMKKILLTAAAFGLVAGHAVTAHASNGYFAHGYSIKNKGMAGAGVAVPLDSMAPATNPALLTEVLLEGTYKSDSEYFLIPNLGYSRQLDEQSAVGLALYGNGGMNTDYDTATFNYVDTQNLPQDSTGVDLMQLFIAPTYARRLADKHSLGITPILAIQRFEAKGVGAFGGFSSDMTKLSNNDHDTAYGFGGRIGYLGRLTDQFSVGLSYQTKIYMGEFDDYAGLFAEQGDFDIPSNWTLGFAFMPTPAVTVAVDVQQIYYGDIDSIANPLLPNLFTEAKLGNDNGAGFGWEDMTVYKIGLQWARSEQWTYRFGYSYGEQPIPDSEVIFNILAPGVIEQHATFGFTYTLANGSELDFAFTYAFEENVKGSNPLDPDAQTIELTMDQWEIGIGYSWKF
jgi:long-chain fatty acid transport protein